jgi:5-methyltetrahydropteroyltriglutamate--homocysteine methyltransferase
MFDDPGRKHRRAPACNAPITMRDLDAPKQDAQRLQRSLGGRASAGTFLNAASPGVTTLFFRNDFYPSHEEYLFACAEALRLEYEAIVASGVTLQIDCPDLAMGRHTQFAHLDRNEFRERMTLHVEALNRALINIPAEKVRMHVCWGNYPGPHHCDVPLADIVDILWSAKPHAILFEAANPRHAHEWTLFETVKPPEGKILVPGVIECQSPYIEHPELVAQRIGRYADLVGRDNVMAAVDRQTRGSGAGRRHREQKVLALRRHRRCREGHHLLSNASDSGSVRSGSPARPSNLAAADPRPIRSCRHEIPHLCRA